MIRLILLQSTLTFKCWDIKNLPLYPDNRYIQYKNHLFRTLKKNRTKQYFDISDIVITQSAVVVIDKDIALVSYYQEYNVMKM